MTPTNTVLKLISKDLKLRLESSTITKYHLTENLMICSRPTLERILKGKNGKAIPFQIVCELYKSLGEKEINISGSGVRLLVKL
jgi:hypothetical protein